eukprot:gene361-biopygen15136
MTWRRRRCGMPRRLFLKHFGAKTHQNRFETRATATGLRALGPEGSHRWYTREWPAEDVIFEAFVAFLRQNDKNRFETRATATGLRTLGPEGSHRWSSLHKSSFSGGKELYRSAASGGAGRILAPTVRKEHIFRARARSNSLPRAGIVFSPRGTTP